MRDKRTSLLMEAFRVLDELADPLGPTALNFLPLDFSW